jgi:hypothetical protein
MDTLQPTSQRTAELDRLGDEIAELSAHLEAATGRLLDLIRAFDARGGWNTGFCSCAAWLSWRVGLDLGAARERVRVARALGALPSLAEALARGELSYAKVRALTRVATPATEARLLAIGRAGTASNVERIVRGWRHMDRKAEAREAARQHAGRALHVYQDEDGTVVLRGRLAPEVGALLLRALDAARETLYQRGRAAGAMPAATAAPTRPQQQADALALLAETALHHELDPGAPGERYQVVVHVDAAVLADPEQPGQSVLEEGSHVSAETSRRLACDASRVVMRHDEDGQVVEIGARTRTIPPALRRALHHRGPELPLPWLPSASRPGPSRAPLGPGRPDDPVEPRVTVSVASPRGARGGLPDRAGARQRAPVLTARWPAAPRRASTGYGARGSGGGPPRAAPGRGASASRAHGTLAVAGEAPRRGVGDRRTTSRGDGLGALPGRRSQDAGSPNRVRRSSGDSF